ncbi:DUF2529 family protein [Salipaludibacillus daqingensis]|uniref:DUF2529 family protein n=1 Tax=Salipaludibacillus daqingensis TaxID=3041001 RepID=UPI0024771A5F|nr:DUF2529 family protein [Salipaludibacillus daqingensis]
MKIFETQMKGLIEKLNHYEEDLEDAARVIAQSMVSDGRIFWHGEEEMAGIVSQACFGADKFKNSSVADDQTIFSPMDTLIIASPTLSVTQVKRLIEKASDASASVITIYSHHNDGQDGGDFSFCTGVKGGLVPMESGERIGTPHLLVALQLYYHLYFAVMEMLEEHEMLE